MRKLLLVLALVAASFAGGAVVNGPGLQWLKGMVRERMGANDHIPTLEVDDGSNGAEPTDKPAPAQPVEEIPAAPAPSPLSHGIRPHAEPDTPPPVTAEPTNPQPDHPAAEATNTTEAKDTAEPPSLLPELPEPPKDKPPAPTGWEDAPGPGPTTAVVPRSPAKPRVANPAPTDDRAVAPAASTPTDPPPSDPAPAEPPALVPSVPAAMPVPPIAPTSSDWGSLRKRMKALGVKEYSVQGTPGGSVTFRCVAPEAGPDSTARTFDAEGDDEFAAAESALRRVALWRATRRAKESTPKN